jgi:hypothetical protein
MKKPNWKAKCKEQAKTIERMFEWRIPGESTEDWLKRKSKKYIFKKRNYENI